MTAAVAVSPAPVWAVIQGYSAYWALAAAVEVGLFARLADGSRPAHELGGDERVLESVLDALVVLGLIARDGPRVGLTDVSAAYLVPGRDRYLGDVVVRGTGPHANWQALAETVRSGSPPAPVDDDPASFYGPLVEATLPTQVAAARSVLDAVPTGSVLELGAGAAPWALALLERDPAASAVVNDLPGVLPVARRTLASLGDRCTFVAGDYLEVDVATGAFDVVVLGHLLRAESRARCAALVARAAGALAPGGALVVTEYLADDDRRGPAQALLMGATAAACTRSGQACTRGAVRAWLAEAGFDGVVELIAPPNVDVVIATRGEAP